MATTLPPPATELSEERWSAVLERRSSLSSFVYAVKTTGVYCRPGCSSRTPRRENVLFFDAALAAESAGYRACKKCRPQNVLVQDRRVQLVQAAHQRIVNDDCNSVTALTDAMAVSSTQLQRAFRDVLGMSPKEFLDGLREHRVRCELQAQPSVTDAIYAAGYQSASRFYDKCRWILGMKPAAYGEQGRGELILFSTVESILGPMIVAATRVGVCHIAFNDDAVTLKNELAKRFRQAMIVEGDEAFSDWIRSAANRVVTGQTFDQLPLDVQGTAFMRRVWAALREIPRGVTQTYTQLAKTVGQESAVRAVASACAKNELAVIIPCHRILRTDGGLGGYRWGLRRKRELLKHEAEVSR